ncbi:MAG TPA: HlyC/CorC family transporter [Clostridiales bacterium]|nr:HlyC/CorC family transporter [Clostridiales bacterium]
MSWFIIVLLLGCAVYFAMTETAFSSVSKIRVKTHLEKGDRRAKRTMHVLNNFDRAITTILIGTNIVQIVLAALATILATKAWGLSAVAVSTVVTTFVVFFAGEMLPKSIGKKYSERIALSTASSLCFLMRIFAPISYVLSAIGRAVSKLMPGDAGVTVTEDELYDIIESMKDEGELDSEKGELVHSALVFGDVTVESVLTARVDIAAIDVEAGHEEILEFIKRQKHSRLPVYRGSIDNIIGILQIRRYIKAYLKQGKDVDLLSLLDDAYFVPQSAKIDEILSEMSRKKLNMVVVTDNYGGTLGIVTVEDILEELVGEIWDEDDEVVESFIRLEDGSFEIDAGMSVEDAFELMGFEDPQNVDFNHKLMGKWAYEQFDLIPNEGSSFIYNGLLVTVSSMAQNRILKLNARILPPENLEGGEA